MISFKICLNMIKKIFIECCVLHILSDAWPWLDWAEAQAGSRLGVLSLLTYVT